MCDYECMNRECNMKYGILLYVKVILIYFLGLFLRPKPKTKERLELDRFGGCNDLARRGCLKNEFANRQ